MHSDYGPLAQLVEQQTLNLWVGSSKLPWLKTFTYSVSRSKGSLELHARVVKWQTRQT
jgi:hypothetical protein